MQEEVWGANGTGTDSNNMSVAGPVNYRFGTQQESSHRERA